MNAHEIAAAVICLVAFARSQTAPDGGKSPVRGWLLVGIVCSLGVALSLLAGGPLRVELTRALQAIVEAVGGPAFLAYLADKTIPRVAIAVSEAAAAPDDPKPPKA